jgi:hypothetical protein
MAVEGLVALARDDAATYKIVFTGRSRHSADVLPLEGSLALAGRDARLVATFTFPRGGDSRVELRVVDEHGWARVDSSRFADVGEATEDDAPWPLAQIDDADDVTLIASTPDADGRFRVEFPGMLVHPIFIPAINLSQQRVDRTKFSVLIDASGRPVSGTWELHGTGRISGQLQAIVIELDVTFVAYGSDIVITKP